MITLIRTCKRCGRIHITTAQLEIGCRGRFCILRWCGGETPLRPVWAAMLRRLLLCPGEIVSINGWIEWLYGEDIHGGPDFADETVRQHLAQLRYVLRRADFPGAIKTHHGLGFELVMSQPVVQREIAA